MAEAVAYTEQHTERNETIDPDAAFQLACESLRRISASNGNIIPAVKTPLTTQVEQVVERTAVVAREALVKDTRALDSRQINRAVILSGLPTENDKLIAIRHQNTRAIAFGVRTGQPLIMKGKDGVWKGGVILHPPRLALGADKTLHLRFTVGTRFGHDPEHVDYSIRNAVVERSNGIFTDGNDFAATAETIVAKLKATIDRTIEAESRQPAARIRSLTELASLLTTLPRLEITVSDCGITPSATDKASKLLTQTFLSNFATPDQLSTIPRALLALDPGVLVGIKKALLHTIWPDDLPFSTMMLRTTFAGEGFTRFAHIIAAQKPTLTANQITVDTMSELAQLLKMRLNSAP